MKPMSMSRTLGVVTGLPMEARTIARAASSKPLLACHGPGGDRARLAARELIDRGATALASIGFAGALDPDFEPGDIVVAVAVRAAGRTPITTDDAWHRQILCRADETLDIMPVTLLQTADVVTQPRDKKALGKVHGAQAVDMESYAVAEIAQQQDVPFVAIRVISDRAEQLLPDAALRATQADGAIHILPVLASLIRRPGQIRDLIDLGKQSGAARRSLGRFVKSSPADLFINPATRA